MLRRTKRSVARAWYRARFLLFQRHRFDRLALEWCAGRPFLILPHVFNPALFWSSEFMVQSFNSQLIPSGSRVLDMGTGSGIGAVFAAQWAKSVTAVDVNPAAVRCAQINVLLNRVERCVTVREGDLFSAVPGETFDVILFNPPYFRGEPKNSLDRAFHAQDVIERFAAELPAYLNPDGYALVLLSSAGDESRSLAFFQQAGYEVSRVAERPLATETLTLYQLEFVGSPADSPAATREG